MRFGQKILPFPNNFLSVKSRCFKTCMDIHWTVTCICMKFILVSQSDIRKKRFNILEIEKAPQLFLPLSMFQTFSRFWCYMYKSGNGIICFSFPSCVRLLHPYHFWRSHPLQEVYYRGGCTIFWPTLV